MFGVVGLAINSRSRSECVLFHARSFSRNHVKVRPASVDRKNLLIPQCDAKNRMLLFLYRLSLIFPLPLLSSLLFVLNVERSSIYTKESCFNGYFATIITSLGISDDPR